MFPNGASEKRTRKMLKRKQMIIAAAAAVAAAPLAAQAAINVAFGYDATVTIANNAAFTGSTTVQIVAGAISVPAGDFFKFNVNTSVTGDSNAASGGAYDTANGTLQPANLGLAGFGFDFANTPSVIAPVITAAKSTVTIPAALKYDISAKGTANATNAGIASAPLSAGYNPGLVTKTAFTSQTHGLRLTLGAGGTKADIFTGLTYQAGTSAGVATITPTNPAGTVAYAFLTSPGDAATFPSYTSDTVGTNIGDTLTALPALVVNVTGGTTTTPPAGHNIVNLTTTTQTGGNYGVQLTQGTGTNQATFNPNTPVANNINVVKGPGAGSYTPGFANNVNNGTGNATDFTAVSGFTAGDQEVYALKLKVGTGTPTSTQISSIVSDISAETGTGVSTVANLLSPSAGLATQIAGLFPGYDLMLTVTTGSATPFLGFDFSQETNVAGVVVTDIAVVPEPASAAVLLIGASSLMLGRRKRTAVQA
jgi:hypothetical protein